MAKQRNDTHCVRLNCKSIQGAKYLGEKLNRSMIHVFHDALSLYCDLCGDADYNWAKIVQVVYGSTPTRVWGIEEEKTNENDSKQTGKRRGKQARKS